MATSVSCTQDQCSGCKQTSHQIVLYRSGAILDVRSYDVEHGLARRVIRGSKRVACDLQVGPHRSCASMRAARSLYDALQMIVHSTRGCVGGVGQARATQAVRVLAAISTLRRSDLIQAREHCSSRAGSST